MGVLTVLISVTSLGAFALFSRLNAYMSPYSTIHIYANTILYHSKDLCSKSRSL